MKRDSEFQFPLLDTVVTGTMMFAVAAFTVVLFFTSDVLTVLV